MRVLFTKKSLLKIAMFCMGVFLLFIQDTMVAEATGLLEEPIRLDNFTGEVISGDIDTREKIRVNSGCSYEAESGLFVFPIDDQKDVFVKSSVADGMVTNNAVSIEFSMAKEYSLIRNGVEVQNADLSSINETGNYILSCGGKKVLEFKIVGEFSTLEFFYTPIGFYVKEVLIDGEPAQYESNVVSMTAEGKYEVTYICEATNRTYVFSTNVDRTAPVLMLEELDKKGRAKGPVDISDREQNSTIKVLLNGQEIDAKDTLTKSGKYTVTIYDRAGNSNTYKFTIMIYLNMSSTFFLLLIIAIVVGITVYIVISAKRLKVF